MADTLDEILRRLARLEELLARQAQPAVRNAVPEMRSTRGVLARLDDVWVAVTEGNERLAATLAVLDGRVAALEGGVADLPGRPGLPGQGGGLGQPGRPGSAVTGGARLRGDRVAAIEDALGRLDADLAELSHQVAALSRTIRRQRRGGAGGPGPAPGTG